LNSIEKYIAEYKQLNLDKVVDYSKFNRYAITAHSTQIEGSTLTLEETSLLIDEGITPKGKPLEHSLMVTDHHKALTLAIKLGKDSIVITQKIISELNAQLMASTGQIYRTVFGDIDASKGKLRKGQVFVQNRYFPNFEKVPVLLEQYCETVNDSMSKDLTIKEQLELSFSAHFNLVSIHPYYDGNGRTSRLLMNMIQSKYDLPLGIVYKEDKLQYFQALEDSREVDSIEPFHKFMEDQYMKFLLQEIDRYKEQVVKKDKGRGTTLLF